MGVEGVGKLGEACSNAGVLAEAGIAFLLLGGLIAAVPGLLNGCILPSLMARRAAKCASTSIFLMRLIASPVVLCEDPLWPVSGRSGSIFAILCCEA